MKMTKRDFAVKIATDLNLKQNAVASVVQKTFDYLSKELISGRDIELRNFGVFETVTRQAKKGRNPKRPEKSVIIPKRIVVRFRTGKELKVRVEKLNAADFKK